MIVETHPCASTGHENPTKGLTMNGSALFKDGNHVKAARAMAGLKQSELASLAGLHVNSVKRLERLAHVRCRGHVANRVAEALKRRGVIAATVPMPLVRLAEGK